MTHKECFRMTCTPQAAPLAFFALFLTSIIVTPVFSQPGEPCSSPQSAQFDFWIGDWEVSWTDSGGNTITGTNRVEKRFGGCVIQENFTDPSTGFEGTSWSVYIPVEDQWKQTWVDNQGGYLDFTGAFDGETMALSRKSTRGATPFHQRMVWYNITNDELDWNWERSDDDGDTWILLWQIHYKRKASSPPGE